jgi:pilus assembly protein CpaC
MKAITMRKTALCSALATTLAMLSPTIAPMQAQAQNAAAETLAKDLVLSVGRGRLINLPRGIADVFIANDTVADVQVRSSTQLYVFGKAAGETSVYATDAAGKVVFSTIVRVGNNMETIDEMLGLAMPDASIRINTMNGFVLLTGTVPQPEDAAEAERLVNAFVGDKIKVISRLQTATPLQVNLQVRIAEVNKSLLKEIGGNITTRDIGSGLIFGTSRGRNIGTITDRLTVGGNPFPVASACSSLGLPATCGISLPYNPATGQFITGPGQTGTNYTITPNPNGNAALNFAGRLFGLDILSALDLAERSNLVATLANPNLTALSGETAEFLAGGEFPVPSYSPQNGLTIEFKKFGVSLAYTPTVMSNGRISMRVRPEVSELSSEGSIRLEGFEIPALTVRRAETSVELGSGESFMIAGLMSNRAIGAIDKAPGLGDVPVLGTLFKSDQFRRGETELVIVVTPYLVKPVNANDIKLPTDAFRTSTDAKRLLINQTTDGQSGGSRPMPSVAPNSDASPQVGAAPTMPAPPKQASKADEKASRKDKKVADAAPGFGF